MSSEALRRWAGALMIAFSVGIAGNLAAQDAQSEQATAEKPAPPPPTDDKQSIMAKVIEVAGDVKYAPLESQDYKPVKLGDEFPEKTKIITGVHSAVKLQIGDEEPYTCLLIEAVGKTVLSEAYKTSDTKKVRVGVGYGRIRAGVAEGGLKSDFTVDSPVATLSKRGTWGFTLFYERDTHFFEIGLTDRGLVEAINKLTKQRRTLNPKELITSAMRAWLDQSGFERNISIPDIFGQGDISIVFNSMKQSGLGVTAPGSGQRPLLNLTNPKARARFAELLKRGLPPLGALPSRDPGLRAEGFFGTGRGDDLVEVMIEANNPLAQKGFARPGLFKFRRSVAEGWLKNQRGCEP